MKYSIHRALAMAKTTEKRLIDVVDELSKPNALYDFRVGKQNKTIAGVPIDEAEKAILARYDKYQALIANYVELKLAIVRSNGGITDGTTNIKEYDTSEGKRTLAEVIVLLGIINRYEVDFNQTLSKAVLKADTDIRKKNSVVEDKLSALLNTIGSGDKTKLGAADIEATTKSFYENNAVTLVDPLKISKLFADRTKWLADKQAEIDAVISEANALTTIEVNM